MEPQLLHLFHLKGDCLLTKFSSLSTSLDNNPSTFLSSWCVINMSTSCPEGLPLFQEETEINTWEQKFMIFLVIITTVRCILTIYNFNWS